MDCLRWSKTFFLRIAEITLHILTILRASCSREGIINCINWRNSIEFKFYGNQFHCARHRWRQWCDDEAATQQKTKKIPPVNSINPKISRASIIFNKVDTYVLMLIKLAAGLQSILRYLTLSPELRNKVSEIIAEYFHLLRISSRSFFCRASLFTHNIFFLLTFILLTSASTSFCVCILFFPRFSSHLTLASSASALF